MLPMSHGSVSQVSENTADNKQNQVYEKIRNAILDNEFPPGTMMVERKLSEKYGVSRSPIRNALQQLTFEGLLAYSAGGGMIVPVFTLEDIVEVYDMLEILQSHGAKISIRRMDAVNESAFFQIMKNMLYALNQKDVAGAAKWDARFHSFIIDQTSNKRLQAIYQQLRNHQIRFLSASSHDISLYERSYQEHQVIYDCMVSKDTKGAQAAVQAHFDSLRKYYIDMLLC